MSKNKKNHKKQPRKPEWMIHLIANDEPCLCCNKIEQVYIDGICDAHTHGLQEKYDHLEFQMVARYPNEVIMYILNAFGDMVKNGRRFEHEFVSGIFTDCDVRLDKAVDDFGDAVLRVVIPDSQNRWPEDPACEYPYNMQTRNLSELKFCPTHSATR